MILTINMTKDSAPVKLTKDVTITAEVTWPARTDYDLGAEILYEDGTTESLATFGAKGVPAKEVSKHGTVRHQGDAVRGVGTATETITVAPDAQIKAIAFWAYSAQSNGTGSFKTYAVSMKITAGDQTVEIKADNASEHSNVYTCVPGIVRWHDGVPQVEYAELYSQPTSETRPYFAATRMPLFGGRKGEAVFKVDGGPRNDFK